jgi:hypothetical protein
MKKFVMMLVGIIGIAVVMIQANEKDADAWCRYLAESGVVLVLFRIEL